MCKYKFVQIECREKVFAPSFFFFFILHKDNASKYKMQF